MVLLKRLIKDGARQFYGVGIQGHWSTATIPYAAIDKAIADYVSLGLKVSITELDVTIRGSTSGASSAAAGQGGGMPPSPQGSQGPGGRLCEVVPRSSSSTMTRSNA